MSDFPIIVYGIDEPVTLHRGCFGTSDKDLRAAMRSNYEIGRRPHPVDLRVAVLYVAVSMFEEAGAVRRAARALPHRVGAHIAEIALQPGLGLCRAEHERSGPLVDLGYAGPARRLHRRRHPGVRMVARRGAIDR